jgi:hypothetical protein
MSLDNRLLALIGRRFPAIYDVIPRGGQLVALNPQPLPPGEKVELNPQPIPPGFGDWVALNPQPLPPRALGAVVAAELLRLSWAADKLGSQVAPIADWEDDPCPTWPKVPHLPPHLGPPPPDPGPDWLVAYHLGLASTLAEARERVGASQLADEALERSTAALDKALS